MIRPKRPAASSHKPAETLGSPSMPSSAWTISGLLAGCARPPRELGLAHSPPEAVALTRDKAAMRPAFSAAGVPQPSYEVIAGGVADDVADAAGRLGPAVVVKPCSAFGQPRRHPCRLARRARRAAALRIWAILEGEGEPASSHAASRGFRTRDRKWPSKALLRDSHVDIITIFDKPDPLDGPYFEETLYVSPSRLSPRLPGGRRRATAVGRGSARPHRRPVPCRAAGPWCRRRHDWSAGGGAVARSTPAGRSRPSRSRRARGGCEHHWRPLLEGSRDRRTAPPWRSSSSSTPSAGPIPSPQLVVALRHPHDPHPPSGVLRASAASTTCARSRGSPGWRSPSPSAGR